jgi:hypothetical protein
MNDRNFDVIIKEEMKDSFEDFDIDTESFASSKDLHSLQVFLKMITNYRYV